MHEIRPSDTDLFSYSKKCSTCRDHFRPTKYIYYREAIFGRGSLGSNCLWSGSGWIIMEKIQDVKGLGGMLNGFRDLVKDDKKIVFVGSPGFCTPFALFLGYPVREKELVFLPGLDMKKARSITATEYGMELGGAASTQADVVVILGGMAMPKIGVKPEEMKEFLSKMKYKKLIGVCFMSIFEKAGWCQALPFEFVMNIILEGDVSH